MFQSRQHSPQVMCAKWLNGTCRAGSRCRFAHGQHELQDPPEDEEEDEFDVPAGSEWIGVFECVVVSFVRFISF